MHTVRTLVRAALGVALLADIVAVPAAPSAITPVVRLNLGEAARNAAKTAMVRDVLPGEIPGIRWRLD